MNVLDYWRFSGRSTRLQWWRFQIWTLLGLMVVVFAAINIGENVLRFAVVGLAVAVWALAALGVSVRRLHDRNKSAWWLILFYVVPAAFAAGAGAAGPDGAYVLTAPAGLINLWALVELGFLRGTAGPNQYGNDPAAAA